MTLHKLALALAPALLLASPAAAGDDAAGGASVVADADGNAKVGAPLPKFAGWSPDGKMVSLSRVLRGDKEGPNQKPVVVSFFATWCKPCEHGLPHIQAVSAREDVHTILVSYGEDGEKVSPFLQKLGVTQTVVTDPFLKVSERVGVTKSLPRTYVLDKDGVVRTIFVQEGDDFEARLSEAVAAARAPAEVAKKDVGKTQKTAKRKRPRKTSKRQNERNSPSVQRAGPSSAVRQ